MIFLTVGSHEPFDRLVRGVDEWCAERGFGDQVFGQITARAGYHPQHFEWIGALQPPEFAKRFQTSSFIIAHAGMGTIITALSKSKPIAVMPRRGHLNETRNDHQFFTVQRLCNRPGIVVANSDETLFDTLDQLVSGGENVANTIEPYANPELIRAVREFILE